MNSFTQNIREVLKRDAGTLKKLVIDLSIALTDQKYTIAGNFFYIWDSPDGTSIDIKVNRTSEQPITYVEQTGLRGPFEELYITTPAGQAGDLTLVFGTEFPSLVEVIDNRGTISGDLATIRDELKGDTTEENWGTEKTVGAAAVQILAANADRKACIVQAKSTNSGIVYLGFDNTVTTTKWFAELLPSMVFSVDDYRGDIYAYGSAAGQLVGWGEW